MEEYTRVLYGGDPKKSEERNAWREILRRRKVNTVLIRPAGAPSSSDTIAARFGRYLSQAPLFSSLRQWFPQKNDASEESPDLETRLLRDGWDVFYEDEQAVVLRCATPCS